MKRFFSVVKRSISFEKAFLFDIDGVLLNASSPVEGAKEALDLLLENNVPFAFLTNGGGVYEMDYLKQTLEDLGYYDSSLLDEIPIVLSHTPMRELLDVHKNENILVVGAKKTFEVACSYGFENAISIDQIAQYMPEIHTHHHDHYRSIGEEFPEYEPSVPFDLETDFYDMEFNAVLFFYHSIQLDRDLQIMVDLLRSNGRFGTRSPHQVVKLYTSNSDFVYGSKFPLPRFGQGFQHDCLRAGYERITGNKLLIEKEYGKPERIQFEYAMDLLTMKENYDDDDEVEFGEVFMIGDSPFSDIKGAKELGFTSCLVKTGVYNEDYIMPLDDDSTPDFIFENVYEAVKTFV